MSYNIDPKFWDLNLFEYSLELSLSVVTFLNSKLNLFMNPFEFIVGIDEYLRSLIKTFSNTSVL